MKKKLWRTWAWGISAVTAGTAVALQISLTAQAADNSQDYRRKVIGIAGIIQNVSTELEAPVTRAQFAHMLVQASGYRDYLPSFSKVSVYADVPKEYSYASSIRIAAEENWMTGYLGGTFRPDQPITLREAVRGILALLGYTSSDFTGDAANSRMAQYYTLELNEEVDRQPEEILNKTDCINLFYNLLKTESKSTGQVYGLSLGCTVNADGEINPMGLADTNLTGPKLIPKGRQLGDYVPFNVQEASIYVNGEASSYESLKSCISSNYVVIYYNQKAKTIWAYVADEDVQSGRCVVRGTVENIYYSSSDVMTPTSITLEGESDEYKLASSDMQFAFSIYGSLRVGDTVTLVCEKTENADGDVSYTVVDYVEE